MLRSLLAVLAGIAVLSVASFAFEWIATSAAAQLFPASFPNPEAIANSEALRAIQFCLSLLSIAAAGYVTARLAPRAPIGHALILGAIQTALTAWAWVSLFDAALEWHWVVGIPLTLPAAWSGARLFSGKHTGTAPAPANLAP